MSPNMLSFRDVDILQDNKRLLIRVPYHRAERFREFFKKLGIGSTLHLDPADKDARLELWTNLDAGHLRALLADAPS